MGQIDPLCDIKNFLFSITCFYYVFLLFHFIIILVVIKCDLVYLKSNLFVPLYCI